MENRRHLKDPAYRPPFLSKKLKKFVRYFSGSRRVLEIGCGWGEFLDMLRDSGVPVEGVEADAVRVAHVRGKGHPVHHLKGSAFLKKSKPGSFDGVFLSNLIEHLEVPEAKEMLSLVHRQLPQGGRLAITTMNPRCLPVITYDFWNDMQHTRPYPLPMLREILEDLGFRVLEARPDEDTRPQSPWRKALRTFRTLLIGPYFEASEIYVLAEKA